MVGGVLSEFVPVIMCAALSLLHHITVSVSITGVLQLDQEGLSSGGGLDDSLAPQIKWKYLSVGSKSHSLGLKTTVMHTLLYL